MINGEKFDEYGITLIALIVSIIILIILAGVSISAIVRGKWDIISSYKSI